jgi:S-adenosylmethionine:tRNA ribosyltransferase-isomerase
VEHRRFRDCIELLDPTDLLVLNNTRVSAVRLVGHKETGGSVEALLLSERGPGVYEAMMRPGKSLRPGTVVEFEGLPPAVVRRDLVDGLKELGFERAEGLDDLLRQVGRVPLPPYIHERLEEAERYQTVYGDTPGSAAAPTAGLHFTDDILRQLEARGVNIAYVTLHVGLDTFRPVKIENLDDHQMHGEICEVTEPTAAAIRACTGRIVAVGTTTVRTLESFATGLRNVSAGQQSTRLFIRPGYQFKVVDGMFTNFHLPETTMLMMISALAGKDRTLGAYEQAIQERYRFLSFGDSMLIL